MYATRKVNIKQWEHQSPEERYEVQISRGGKPVPGIQSDRVSRVEEEVMYWRKANHIHAWFVNNVQNGTDDCREYYVDWGNLARLCEVCKAVIDASKLVDGTVDGGTYYDKDHPHGITQRVPGKVIEDASVAQRLLPTREGFFFGSTEYDEDYLGDVVATHEWAKRMLADKTAGTPGDIYYFSSW